MGEVQQHLVKVGTDNNGSFIIFCRGPDKIIITTTSASTTFGIGATIPIYLFKIQYLNVQTSNIFYNNDTN